MLDPKALLLAGVMASGGAVSISTSTQSNQDCLYRLDHSAFVSRQETAGDEVRLFAGGGVRWSCVRPIGTRDSVTVWRGGSDSLAQYVGRGRADFVGNAWFRDSTVELTNHCAALLPQVFLKQSRGMIAEQARRLSALRCCAHS